jgi:hypothetical protein
LVEVHREISDRDEAKLRRALQDGEPFAVSRVFDKRPRAPLTPLPAREATSVRGTAQKRMTRDEKTLDSADDVIHGNWPKAAKSQARKTRLTY